MKVLVKSVWGSDDPTKAAFPFLHANAIVTVGWPSLPETLEKTMALGIPIHA